MVKAVKQKDSLVILITGAASGLGWALTQLYVAQGHKVLMVDVQQALLIERAQMLNNAEQVQIMLADVTDSEAVTDTIEHVKENYGRLDVLINNAGITHRSLVEKTQTSVFKRVMAVDYQGPVELAIAALPLLKESKGLIINVSSMAGWMPVLGRAGYCAAKSALHQFFEVMRCEVKQYGVRILMVYPSFLDTPIEVNALGANGERATHARSLVGALGNAEDVAKAIVKAHQQGKTRLFPDKFTWVASVFYKPWPDMFLKTMSKKFASELKS